MVRVAAETAPEALGKGVAEAAAPVSKATAEVGVLAVARKAVAEEEVEAREGAGSLVAVAAVVLKAAAVEMGSLAVAAMVEVTMATVAAEVRAQASTGRAEAVAMAVGLAAARFGPP
eukprot:5832841-Pleurochrysis_carterae.AAC.2